LKRIRPYAEIAITNILEVALSGTNNPEVVIRQEGMAINKYLDEKLKSFTKTPFIVCLDYQGVMYDSAEFADFIAEKASYNDILFVIGGVYGLAEEVKRRCNLILSLSKLTFTHQMVRIILLEQLYRAFTIIHGKKYHY